MSQTARNFSLIVDPGDQLQHPLLIQYRSSHGLSFSFDIHHASPCRSQCDDRIPTGE